MKIFEQAGDKMNQGQELSEVIDERGEVGFIDLTLKPQNAASEHLRAVRLGDGATVIVTAERLTAVDANNYRFAGSFRDAHRDDAAHPAALHNTNQQNSAAIDAQMNERGQIVVPLMAEEIHVGKKIVETGGVRVHKTVREEVRTINEPTVREHLDIERVEVNRFVETAPGVRYEGEVMIVPVLEEVVVTQKRLLLREEIRLTRRREEVSIPQQYTLRREEINLAKIDADDIESGTPGR